MKKLMALLLALALCLTVCSALAETAAVSEIMGTVNGTAYENGILGIRCDFPGWTFLSSEEILQRVNISKEMLSEGAQALLETNGPVTVMMAVSSDQLQNTNITVQNAGVSEAEFEAYGAKNILEGVAGEIGPAYANSGITGFEYEIVDFSFAGKTIPCLNMKAVVNGVTIYQKQVVMCRNGYVFYITASTYLNDTTADVLGQFSFTD